MAAETERPEETAKDTQESNLYTPDTVISPHTCRPLSESNKSLVERPKNIPFWCEPCQIKLKTIGMALSHLRSKIHRKQARNNTTVTSIGRKRIKVEEENNSDNGVDSGIKRLRKDDPAAIPEDLLKCELCESYFTNPTLALKHFKGKKHTTKVESVFQKKLAQQMKCEKCNVEFASVLLAFHHFKGKKHLNAATSTATAPPVNPTPEVKQENGIAKQLDPIPADTPLKCDLCLMSFTTQLAAHAHFKGKKHLGKVRHLSISNCNGEKQNGKSDWTVISEV